MKLRTKITLICCIVLAVAIFIIDILILGIEKNNIIDEAKLNAGQNAYQFTNICKAEEELIKGKDTAIVDTALEYFFKGQNDVHNICFREQISYNGEVKEQLKTIYNRTVFDYEFFKKLNFKDGAMDLQYADIKHEKSYYIVYKVDINNVVVYRLEDITYAYERVRQLVIYILIISFSVILLVSAALYFILKYALVSLKRLDENASEIACGNYSGRVSVSGRDEIARLGETFNKMADAVKEREESLTLLMGNLTHELKTPMAAISGYAQTLLAVKLDDADREEALVYIDEECRRLERLSRKMMRLFDIEAQEALDIREVKIKDIFEIAAKSCRAHIETKNITLEINEHGESLMADGDLLTEVIINLLDNAIKASDEGGVISLTAHDKKIIVRDYGRGIPEDEIANIIKPFYMVDKSRSRRDGGAGLGLALTKLIIEKHHATLDIESKVGDGTSMILQFV